MVSTRPMVSPATDLNTPRSSTATAKTVKARKNVRTASMPTALPVLSPADLAGCETRVAPSEVCFQISHGQQPPQEQGAQDGPHELGQDVDAGPGRLDLADHPCRDGDGGVEMRSRDVPQVRHHDGEDQPVGQGDPEDRRLRDGDGEDRHRSGPDEHERERADRFGEGLLPLFLHPTSF